MSQKCSAPSFSSVSITDEENLSDIFGRFKISPDLQFNSGVKLDYNNSRYEVDGVCLSRTISSSGWGFHKNETVDFYFLTSVSGGPAFLHFENCDNRHVDDHLYFLESKEIISGYYPANSLVDTIIMPSELLHLEMGALLGFQCKARLTFCQEVTNRSHTWKVLSNISMALRDCIKIEKDQPHLSLAVRHLRKALIISILELIPNNYSKFLHSDRMDILPGALKRAVDFIQSHAHLSIGLGDIAKVAGTSGRNLQLLFRSHHGITPMSYLRTVRLQQCRNEFIRLGYNCNIDSVCRKWAFTNKYLFIKYYASHYGEKPEETCRVRLGSTSY